LNRSGSEVPLLLERTKQRSATYSSTFQLFNYPYTRLASPRLPSPRTLFLTPPCPTLIVPSPFVPLQVPVITHKTKGSLSPHAHTAVGRWRCDPHPAWSRDFRYIAVNARLGSSGGLRQVLVLQSPCGPDGCVDTGAPAEGEEDRHYLPHHRNIPALCHSITNN